MKNIQVFVGCFFLAISAFLYATKHITAAIISSNINSPSVNYYEGALDLVGAGITFWTITSLVAGIVLLLSRFIGAYKRNVKEVPKAEQI